MIALAWDDEAQCELNCSALYYAKREGAGLAERFIQAVEDAIMEVRASPAMHRTFRGTARRVQIARFPYSIVYTFDEARSIIRIVAVAHSSRDPWILDQACGLIFRPPEIGQAGEVASFDKIPPDTYSPYRFRARFLKRTAGNHCGPNLVLSHRMALGSPSSFIRSMYPIQS